MSNNLDPTDQGQARLRKTVLVGRKTDPVCPNTILLQTDKPFSFGRLPPTDVNIRLLSREHPLMISRKHATVACNGGQWTVTDHSTSNGVAVNGTRIPPNQAHPILHGDKVTFGCGVDGHSPEFEYLFECENATNKRALINCIDVPAKRRKVLSNVTSPNLPSGSSTSSLVSVDRETKDQAICNSYDSKIRAEEEKLELLTQQLTIKHAQCKELQQRMEDNEKVLMNQLQGQRCALEREKTASQDMLEQLLNEKLNEKEQLLKSQFNEQISMLEEERQTVENHLQTELNRKLTEQNKLHQEELQHQKSTLERILRDKEVERANLEKELSAKQHIADRLKSAEEIGKKLESTLDELKEKIKLKETELNKQQEVTRVAEELARKSVVEQMEDEFTCIVCQELFIRAATLPCAHTFCSVCIHSWMKKKNNCPVCRCRVRAPPVLSVVLDSAVAKIVECLDEEAKERRTQVFQQRVEEEQNQLTEQRPATSHRAGHDSVPITSEGHNSEVQITYESTRHNGSASGPSRNDQGSVARNRYANRAQWRQQRRGRLGPAYQHHAPVHEHPQHRGGQPYPTHDVPHHGADVGGARSFSQPSFDAPEASYNNNNAFGHCYNCGLRGHYARHCPFQQ